MFNNVDVSTDKYNVVKRPIDIDTLVFDICKTKKQNLGVNPNLTDIRRSYPIGEIRNCKITIILFAQDRGFLVNSLPKSDMLFATSLIKTGKINEPETYLLCTPAFNYSLFDSASLITACCFRLER